MHLSHPLSCTASGKIRRCDGLFKTTLKAAGGGTLQLWEKHLAEAPWLVSTGGSIDRDDPSPCSSLRAARGDEVPAVHVKNALGKAAGGLPASGKGRAVRGAVCAQGAAVGDGNGAVQCAPRECAAERGSAARIPRLRVRLTRVNCRLST